jgi:predicted nucleic acid binding AN1-type Zn finger protein
MTNSYSISRSTWKWIKKLFFHLLDLPVLNSYILLTSCGSKLTHHDFRLTLVRDVIQEEGEGRGRVPRPQTTTRGRPTTSTSQPTRLDSRHNEHWLSDGRRVRCRVCAAKNKETRTKFSCSKCNVGLCVDPCFRVYHTQMHF